MNQRSEVRGQRAEGRGRRIRPWANWLLVIGLISACQVFSVSAFGQVSKTLNVNPSSSPVQVHETGTSTTTPLAATSVASTALEASHVLKASAGRLVSFHCYNSKASAQYILIMDSATVPANGAVTLLYPPIYVPATSNVSLVFPVPLTASTGISVSNSSTGTFTKTIGSSDCVFLGQVQ